MKPPRPASPDGVPQERPLQLLIDAVTDTAIFLLGPAGLVSLWTPGAARVTGYAATLIVGQPVSLLFTPEDRRQGLPQEMLAQAAATGRADAEGWRMRQDSSRFWALTAFDAIRDQAGELVGFAAVMRDITERQAAHHALAESERQFRMLIKAVSDYAIYMIDPSGIVTNWNAGAERIKGYRADEIVGKHFSLFYSAEDRAGGLPARALHLAATEGRFESEGWRIRGDGTRFWASAVIDAIRDEDGRLIGFAKITRDITERRAAQEALRESERRFRLLVAGVSDYAIFMLDPNGIVTNWNIGAQRIKGYTADEIVGHHFSRFYTEPERIAGVPARALQTATAEGKYEVEGWRVRKDGSHFWASVVIDAIRDEEGRLIGFAKVTRDITERREAQLALERANQQLAQAQKMEALGQLTGGVAHDFNNLLMIVSGHAQMLRNRATDPRDIKALEAIAQAASRGESLTRQLLAFSRRQPLRPEAVRLQDWIGGFREMLSSSAGRASLAVSLPPDIWPIRVDIAELELALVNIVVNARDAMPEGGIVTFTAENARFPDKDPASGLTGDYVALSIADSGCGIPPDILPKVFDPFFTTKQLGKGTGLGLSQVHGFVHQSGGSVTVTSELGAGTRFTLYLPKATAPGKATAARGEPVAGVGGTVLLIEDNPEVAQVSAALLAQLGYEVVTAVNAEHALEVLAGGRRVDLVFTDVVMPGMDGIALARKLGELHPHLPVLVTTGYANAAEKVDLPILRKPYDIGDLGRAVANLLAGRNASDTNLVKFRRGKPRRPRS